MHAATRVYQVFLNVANHILFNAETTFVRFLACESTLWLFCR